MTTSTFTASVQYNDWKGTSAADNADDRDLTTLLKAKKLYNPESDFLIGVRVWIGENHGGRVQEPWIEAIIADAEANTFDELDAWLQK